MQCQRICMRLSCHSCFDISTYPGDECFSKLIDVFRIPLTDFLDGGVSCTLDAISVQLAGEIFATTKLLCALRMLPITNH